MKATTVLAEFASKTRLDDIAAEAVAATKRHILDCTGVALAATSEPAGRIVVDITREQGGEPTASVLGTTLRTGVVSAAWANGSLAHLLDFDDTGFSHPTACILPAALAMAEEAGSTGGELVAAVCVGLEVFERMSSSGRQHEHVFRARGFHPTSLYGCSAAAAAAGSIAGLNPRQMGVAIGLAAANAGGLTQHFGTWGKGIHAGNAARAGVTSVLLARKDYVADPAGLEGDYGFYSAFHGDGNYTLDKMADGLGTQWSIVDPGLTIKRYPCCGGNLRALDAAEALVTEHDIHIDDVEQLEVDVHPDLLDIVRFHKPEGGFRGKFSIDYVLAAMMLDRRVDLDSFADAYCNAPRMRAALEKVAVNAHPEWPHDAASRRKAPVTITMKDGQTFTRQVNMVRGSPGNPMTRDELVDKYRGCAARVLNGEGLERSIVELESLETIPAVKTLVNSLTA
ncbi:MAG: MmgE/PrpD family protein [Rhodospirillaceae bacterium]|jgi:2-methylcitrate dehydratase PrpD|nr:MmgE/PrpD family protein [Rhodospirillaceae bacterium]